MKKIYSVLIIMIFALMLGGCANNKVPNKINFLLNEEDMGVYSVKDQEELATLIGGVTGLRYDTYIFSTDMMAKNTAVDETSPTDSTNTDPSGADYETNVQIKGVDEGDIVKVDGNFIYYLHDQQFLVFEKTVAGLVLRYQEEYVGYKEEANKITSFYNFYPQELYYTEDYVVVLCRISCYRMVELLDATLPYSNRYLGYTKIMIYDKATFNVAKTYQISANTITTRLVDNQLLLLANGYASDEEELRPEIQIDGVISYPDYHDIKYLDENARYYTMIFKFTLDETLVMKDYYFLSASSYYYGEYYITNQQIYLFGTKSESYSDVYDSYTEIMVFDHNGDDIRYGGKFTVQGTINDSYWFDVVGSEIRMVTTGIKYYYNDTEYVSSEKYNHLYIYERLVDGNVYKYKLISEITEGIGKPNESIKSARFSGDRVTVVTFVQTDPLYYIDLSDSLHPVITSELYVTGFSTYQHPYKDDYVIGIGYEANDDGRTTGLKVALYDLTDHTNIQVSGKAITFMNDTGYQYSDALDDPNAILIDLSHDIFGFTINGFNDEAEFYSCYILFKIDLTAENPLLQLDTIEYELPADANPYYYNDGITRMVYIDDIYYVLASDYVASYKIIDNQLVKQEKLPF